MLSLLKERLGKNLRNDISWREASSKCLKLGLLHTVHLGLDPLAERNGMWQKKALLVGKVMQMAPGNSKVPANLSHLSYHQHRRLSQGSLVFPSLWAKWATWVEFSGVGISAVGNPKASPCGNRVPQVHEGPDSPPGPLKDSTNLEKLMWWLISVVYLIRFRITMETNLRACLWGIN